MPGRRLWRRPCAISMARVVGPEGRVIGTDTDADILELAKEDAEAAKITNVEFHSRMLARADGMRSSMWLTRGFCSRT